MTLTGSSMMELLESILGDLLTSDVGDSPGYRHDFDGIEFAPLHTRRDFELQMR